jgi:BON domain
MSDEPRIQRPAPPPGQPDSRDEVDPDVAELLGLRPIDAGSFPTADELDDRGTMTDTAIYEGELTARTPNSDAVEGDEQRLESLAADEARAGETENPDEAAEEGLTWIPPSDPPIRPEVGDDGGAVMAAGFGMTAAEEPFDADHHSELLPDDDERTARVEEALRADGRTTALADAIDVDSEGGRVVLRGVVEDLEDEDAAVAVAEEVEGVTEVVSRLEIATLETTTGDDRTD